MRTSSVRLPALAALGLLVSAGAARASYMNWSYNWSLSPAPVLASGTGTVSQALYSGGKGSAHLLAAAVTTSSSATTNDPDHFNKSFTLTLHLKDLGDHLSGILTFHGLISGTLTANSSHLTETFKTSTEELQLGNHIYKVQLPSSITLLAPGAGVKSYSATVSVTNVLPTTSAHPQAVTASIASVPTASAPEPSSLVLVGLGMTLLGGVGLRRRVRALAFS